ncbi:MAG: zinc-ribbon domain-containing protein [Clostridia bacterium]
MWCKNCGKENEDGVKFCVSCGAPAEINQTPVEPVQGYETQPAAPFAANQEMYNQQPPYDPTQEQYMAPKKSKAVPIIIVVAVLVLALVGGGIYAYTQTTPESVAFKFYNGFLAKDATVVLNNMYQSKDAPITKEKLTEEMAAMDLSKVDAKSLKVYSTAPASFTETPKTEVTLDGVASKDFKTVYLSIMVDGKESATAVYLVKSGKDFLVFDKWVVVFG